MIEFKAECGHTVRARDEDAGKVVRCSYCGRGAEVPADREDDLDFLFHEVDRAGAPAASVGGPRGGGALARTRRSRLSFNPFSVALKMGYAAVLIMIVVVTAKLVVIPLFAQSGGRGVSTRKPAEVVPRRRDRRTRSDRRGSRLGLLSRPSDKGLFVSSVPAGASVYCAREASVSDATAVSLLAGCKVGRTNQVVPDVRDGTFTVDVVLAWNDRRLTRYPGYKLFRERILDAGDRERGRLARAFFLPDRASAVLVQELDDRLFIARRFSGVQVRKGRWKVVHALFLPRIASREGSSFSIEALLGFLPSQASYAFDDAYVRSELGFYGVPAEQQAFVTQALSRIGAIPFVTPDKGTRLFMIALDDGGLLAPAISDHSG